MSVTQGTGRPTGGYFAFDGEKLPSVTQITGRFGDKNGIIYKAKLNWWEAGSAGKPWDREAYWDKALEIGTLVHKKVEAFIHGTDHPFIPTELEERVSSAFDAFTDWWNDTRLTIVATELRLVSETHRFGGTVDAVARDSQGRLTIADWKSSKGIYEDYLWQIAAYGQLWNENNDEQLTGGFRIVRISKEHGDLELRHFPNLDDALETFLHLRRAFDSTKSVKKRAA